MFVIEIKRTPIDHKYVIYFFMVFIWFLFQVMDGSIFPTSEDLPKVVDLATLCTLLSIGWASSGLEPQNVQL